MENFTYSTDSVQDNFAKMVTQKAIEIFGDNLANPSQEPIRFAYQIKVVQFMIELENRK
jgi:hypothetical protein